MLETSFDGMIDRMAGATGTGAALNEGNKALGGTFQGMSRMIDGGTSALDRFVRAVVAALSAFKTWQFRVMAGLAGVELARSRTETPTEAPLPLLGISPLADRPELGTGEIGILLGDQPEKKKGGGKSRTQAMFEGFQKQLERLIPRETLTAVEKMEGLLVSMREAMKTARKSSKRDWGAMIKNGKAALAELQKMELAEALTGDIRESLETLADDLAEPFRELEQLPKIMEEKAQEIEDFYAAMKQQRIDTAVLAIQAIQDPTALLAMAGPGGAVAGAGLGLLQGGAGAVEDTLGGLMGAAKNAGPTLRKILGDLIPTFIAEFPAALITGLIGALPDIVEAFLVKLPIALAKAVINALASLWESFRQLILRLIPGRQKGEEGGPGWLAKVAAAATDAWRSKEGKKAAQERRGFQTGTAFVDSTGMAMLHRGEAVISSSGAVSQSVRGRMGGEGQVIHVHVNGIMDSNVIDQLGRQLQRHFGAQGRSSLPIFGGV
jgi:hypothetical protein